MASATSGMIEDDPLPFPGVTIKTGYGENNALSRRS